MKNLIRLTILIISFSLFFGCAYMPDNGASNEVVNYDQLKQVKTIALLDVATPSKYWMGKASSGVVSGLFGPTVSMATAEHEESDIFGRLNFTSTATDNLRSALENEGFDVILLKADRPSDAKSKLLDDYSSLSNVNADAILDVGPIHIGYREEIGAVNFTEGALSPDVSVQYRLVSTSDQQTIAESNVFYSSWDYVENYTGYWAGAILVGPNEHIFKDKDSLEANPDEAVRRMEYAVNDVAKSIASSLKKSPD